VTRALQRFAKSYSRIKLTPVKEMLRPRLALKSQVLVKSSSAKKVVAQPVKVHAACLTNDMAVSLTDLSPVTFLRRSIAR
jgi:hypothetical protein